MIRDRIGRAQELPHSSPALETMTAHFTRSDPMAVEKVGTTRDPEAPATASGCAPQEVLVAVPALNEAGGIEACLRSLLEHDSFVQGVLVAVADGGSQDGTPDIVRCLMREFPNLRLVPNPGVLQAVAVNCVVSELAGPRHRFLVRCDAHAVYPPDYIRRVAESLARRPDAASVTSVMDARGVSPFERAAAWVVDTPLGSGGSAHRGGRKSGWVDHGHHAGFRLDWFRRIGGYDRSFSHNEDAEYDCRLTRAGGRVWLDSDIRLDYRMRPGLRALARQYWNYGGGRARTVWKHRLKPRPRQMLPVVNLAFLLASLALAPVYPPLAAYPLAYLLALCAVSLVCAAELRSAAGLWAGPALGTMHCAWGGGFLARWALMRAAPVSRQEEG